MNTKDVQLSGLYQKLERLVAAGEVASAYGGAQDIDTPDGDVLSEFIEFIALLIWSRNISPACNPSMICSSQ